MTVAATIAGMILTDLTAAGSSHFGVQPDLVGYVSLGYFARKLHENRGGAQMFVRDSNTHELATHPWTAWSFFVVRPWPAPLIKLIIILFNIDVKFRDRQILPFSTRICRKELQSEKLRLDRRAQPDSLQCHVIA